MSLCWQTDINSSTGSKDVIRSSIICKVKNACRSKLSQRSSLQRRSLYEAERSGLPVCKEDSRDPITVVTVTCSVVGGQNEPSFIHSYGG
ncbi:hypothetical protein AMECASPLE_027557 [Ameca splendens]|uniref:Uncharacterized protein n=1 Tax=Ameca splendens TaxID=208324 RepID=A0ABV0XI97_9TELE